MAAKRQAKAAEPLYPSTEIPDGEICGADGQKLYRGQVVRVPAHQSKTLGVEIEEQRGIILNIYRDHNGRYLLRCWNQGARTFAADMARASAAKIQGET